MVQGETVPYIICVEKDSEGHVSANQKGLAERAHHPEEINAASTLAVDAEYYLTQQVSYGLLPYEAPVMIAEKHLFFSCHTTDTPALHKQGFGCCLRQTHELSASEQRHARGLYVAFAAARVCNVLLKPGGAKIPSPAHEHFVLCDSCPPRQAHISCSCYCQYNVRPRVSHLS